MKPESNGKGEDTATKVNGVGDVVEDEDKENKKRKLNE